MTVRIACADDFAVLKRYDRDISEANLNRSIIGKQVLVLFCGGAFAGWLRYNLFWDNTPFLNMLFLLEEYRGKGYGRHLVSFWEEEMRDAGFSTVLTSTLSTERGQFFFRRMGYVDCGSLLLPGEPLEIILRKELTEGTTDHRNGS